MNGADNTSSTSSCPTRIWLYPLRLLFTAAILLVSVAPLRAQWPVAVGGRAVTDPAVAPSGDVYVLAEDRFLYRFDAHGIRRWRFDVRTMPAASLAVCPGGPIVLGTRDGTVIAVSPAGSELWRNPGSGAPIGNPYCDEEGFVHVASAEGLLRRISPAGNHIWGTELPGAPRLDPVSGPDGVIFCPISGSPVARTDAGAPADNVPGRAPSPASDPSGAGPQVVVLSRDGVPRSRFPLDSEATSHAVVGGAHLVGTETGELTVYGPDGRVSRLDVSDGAVTAVLAGPRGDAIVATNGAERFIRVAGVGDPPSASLTPLSLGLGSGARMVAVAGHSLYVRGRTGLYRIDNAVPKVRPGDAGANRSAPGAPQLVVATRRGAPLTAATAGYGVAVVQGDEWILAGAPAPAPEETPSTWYAERGNALRTGFPLGREIAPRSREWRDNFDYLYLQSHLLSNERQDRLRAIRDLEERVAAGTLRGSADYVVALLRRAAFQDFQGRSSGAVGFADLRARVVRLLGRIGGRSAIGDLLRLGRYTFTAEVDAAILNAFAAVPAGVAAGGWDVIEEMLRRHAGREGAAAVGEAAVSAVEALLAYSGEAPRAGDILTEIVRGAYPREVRLRALQLLEGSDG